MQVAIETNVIKAAICCAPTKDLRCYLNSVSIRWYAGEQTFCIAGADGHCMFIGYSNFEWLDNEQTADFEILVPIEAAKLAVKGAKKSAMLELSALPDGRYTLGDTVFTAVDGKYPDYSRVIPTAVTGEAATFDPEILLRASDAMLTATGAKNRHWKMHQNGNGAGCYIDERAIAVFMPLRDDASEFRRFHMPEQTKPVDAAIALAA